MLNMVTELDKQGLRSSTVEARTEARTGKSGFRGTATDQSRPGKISSHRLISRCVDCGCVDSVVLTSVDQWVVFLPALQK